MRSQPRIDRISLFPLRRFSSLFPARPYAPLPLSYPFPLFLFERGARFTRGPAFPWWEGDPVRSFFVDLSHFPEDEPTLLLDIFQALSLRASRGDSFSPFLSLQIYASSWSSSSELVSLLSDLLDSLEEHVGYPLHFLLRVLRTGVPLDYSMYPQVLFEGDILPPPPFLPRAYEVGSDSRGAPLRYFHQISSLPSLSGADLLDSIFSFLLGQRDLSGKSIEVHFFTPLWAFPHFPEILLRQWELFQQSLGVPFRFRLMVLTPGDYLWWGLLPLVDSRSLEWKEIHFWGR